MSNWAPDYRGRLEGTACRLCQQGRPEETRTKLRFYVGDTCDTHIQKRGVQRGYVTVVWGGRHAVEPRDLSETEATQFWPDVLKVSRAMQKH